MSVNLVFDAQLTNQNLLSVVITPCTKAGTTLTPVGAEAVTVAGMAIGALVSADFGTEVELARLDGAERRLMNNKVVKEGKTFSITCRKRAAGPSGAVIDPMSVFQQSYDFFRVAVIDQIVIGATLNNRTRTGYFVRSSTGDTFTDTENTWTATLMPVDVGANTYTEAVAPA